VKNKKAKFIVSVDPEKIKIRRGKKMPTKIHTSKKDKSKRNRNNEFDE
jgi:hypothetical protein